MELVIDPAGRVRCIYSEAIDLHALGRPAMRRASHVEPDGLVEGLVNLVENAQSLGKAKHSLTVAGICRRARKILLDDLGGRSVEGMPGGA